MLLLYSSGCTNLGSDGGTNQPQSAHLSSWRKRPSCLSDRIQRHPHIHDNVINTAVLPSCKPMLSTVSIMPGIETLAPERHEKNNGLSGSPNLRPGRSIAMHEAIRGKLHVTSHAICHVPVACSMLARAFSTSSHMPAVHHIHAWNDASAITLGVIRYTNLHRNAHS